MNSLETPTIINPVNYTNKCTEFDTIVDTN